MVGMVQVSHMPPLPLPMFFNILACLIANIRHAASLPRPSYHVSVVPGMLDDPA
jgi:hypothetical protein